MSLEYRNLFSIHKLHYVKEEKAKEHCILCSLLKDDTDGVNLSVADGRFTHICVNKFPYNSGHILIFPKRHITDYRCLTDEEETEINHRLRGSLTILDSLYKPSGYNIGYNMGDFAGASISHLHMHVIPRYRNELGFIDIVGGAKIVIEDPVETMKRLRREFKKLPF